MTMVSTGPISLGGTGTSGGLNQSVNVELGRSGTASINMNESAVRTLAGVPSGAISMSNFYGKSNRVALSYTFSANTANASLSLSGLSGYISGKSDITVTINSGVYLYATSTANAGLTLTGGTTGDTLTIVNNGLIMGMGGNAYDGNGSMTTSTRMNGNNGGTALSIPINATINNTNASAYIGGGGGSGGGGHTISYGLIYAYPGGGGAGGGKGGTGYIGGGTVYTAAGGGGGGIGSSGGNGVTNNTAVGGGGGGRIFPSTSTTVTTTGTQTRGLGGTGGGTGTVIGGSATSTGGGAGQAGSTTNAGTISAGGGGGWGASGGTAGSLSTAYYLGTGGAGGKAVALNGKTVTWVSGNTTRVYGAVA